MNCFGVLQRFLPFHFLRQHTFQDTTKPFSMGGLILTVVLLFAFQAQTILAKPLIMLLIAIPLLAQTYGIFALSQVLAKWLKLPREIAAPACLIGTSNFF